MRLPLPALIHFLLVECRQHYALYFASAKLIRDVAFQSLSARADLDRWTIDKFHTLPDVFKQISCTKEGIVEAMWSAQLDFESSNGCYRHNKPPLPNFLGWMNLSMVLLLTVKLLGMLVSFFSQLGVKEMWTSPLYLQWSYRLEFNNWYQAVANTIVVVLVVIFLLGFAGLFYEHSTAAFSLLICHNFPTIFMLVMSAIAIKKPYAPPWMWDDLTFQKCDLNRVTSILHAFQQLNTSNDKWAQNLSDALLQAKKGKPEDLQEMVPNIDSVGGADALIDSMTSSK